MGDVLSNKLTAHEFLYGSRYSFCWQLDTFCEDQHEKAAVMQPALSLRKRVVAVNELL